MDKKAEYLEQNNLLLIKNGRMQIEMELEPDGKASIRDLKSGRLFADGAYSIDCSQKFGYAEKPEIDKKASGAYSVQRKIHCGDLLIVQSFDIPEADDEIEESITLINTGEAELNTAGFSCGFSVGLEEREKERLCEIPFRYHTETGDMQDGTLEDFAKKEHFFSTERNPAYNRKTSETGGAEGWAFYGGGQVLGVRKYNADAMEWSLVKAIRQDGRLCLRFGGAGLWKLGDPEGAACIKPHSSFSFGKTRYKLMDGDWREAYLDYRADMDAKGHGLPEAYNPPVHWNELYNNPFWFSIPTKGVFWHQDVSKELKELYHAEDMYAEAAFARDYHCECLYLDPGWDTSFGSNIWDTERMGEMKAFSKRLLSDYGLKLALHTPLAPWSNNESYAKNMRRVDENGEICANLCVVSNDYIEEKTIRLKRLVEDGAYYFLFDGSWYEGPCYDTEHGHSVPSTRQEHLDAILRLQQRFHQECPDALIEQHDPITGPGTPRYTPVYFMHGKTGAFDEVWAFEFMNEPLEDILSKRAYSLYYYNLAYNLPLYLHIDLGKDNINCIMLWWYLSVCRHIGIGGSHKDEAVREAQKKAMEIYRSNKRFFSLGTFFGLDEQTHIHTLAKENASIINFFNTEDKAVSRSLVLKAEEAGLNLVKQVGIELDIPPMGHMAVKVDWAQGTVLHLT